MAPAVREASADEAPAKLERIEVRPGVILKLTAEEAKAEFDRQAAEEATRQSYQRTVAGVSGTDAAETAGPLLTVLSKAELKSLAVARELSDRGTKDELAARIAGIEPEAEEPDESEGVEATSGSGEAGTGEASGSGEGSDAAATL